MSRPNVLPNLPDLPDVSDNAPWGARSAEEARETHRWQDAEAVAAKTVRVKVADGTQIAHDGRLYAGGETFEAPEASVDAWVAAGWAHRLGKR